MISVMVRVTLAHGYDKEKSAVMARLRSRSINHPGYISSETVWQKEHGQVYWLMKWHSRELWKDWRISDECESLLKELESLGCATSIDVLAYPEAEMRKGSRRMSNRRSFTNSHDKERERRSGRERRVGERRKTLQV